MIAQLPAQPTAFIGREAELQQLKSLCEMPEVRLISILGPGGVGKTRLALAVAEQQQANFRQEVYFLPLLSLNSWDQVVLATAQTLGFELYQETGLLEQLIDYLRDKRILLVFDNFEHLLSVADHVQGLLATAPHVKILLTSCEKLNLRIEVAFLLNSFEIGEWQTVDAAQQADAIQLFVRNAQRVQTRFSFSQANLASVTRICRLVEGMPLGIELAAAWVDALPPDGIADEIDRNYQFLETQSRDIPARHRSMWATFQSSWDRLASDERLSLSRMAVFSGDFTYPAAQAVAGANLRTLQTLINKSMLTYRNDGRYHMHNLLRQYLNSQLLPAELTEHRRAYFQYYLLWLHERESAVKGNGQRKALDAIEREFDNLRTAWNYAIEVDDAAAIYQGLEGFFWFCMMRNRYLEGETLLQNALRQFVPIDDLSARLNLYYLWLRRWREGSFLPRKLVIEQLTELSTVFQRCADLANLAKCNLLLADALSAGKVDYERSSTRMAHD